MSYTTAYRLIACALAMALSVALAPVAMAQQSDAQVRVEFGKTIIVTTGHARVRPHVNRYSFRSQLQPPPRRAQEVTRPTLRAQPRRSYKRKGYYLRHSGYKRHYKPHKRRVHKRSRSSHFGYNYGYWPLNFRH